MLRCFTVLVSGLDCPLAFYISAIEEAGLGALVFFFFSPLSLPCGVLNCLPADVIQPLRNSFCLARLNDSSHSQRLGVRFEAGDATEITFTGKAVGPAKCGELFFPR